MLSATLDRLCTSEDFNEDNGGVDNDIYVAKWKTPVRFIIDLFVLFCAHDFDQATSILALFTFIMQSSTPDLWQNPALAWHKVS